MGTVNLPKIGLNNDVEMYDDQIYKILRRLIIENKLRPEDRLSENELADHFGVSRMPVRKALDRLEENGLIEILAKKGSFVKKISATNIREICFVRTSIETNALREAFALKDTAFNRIVNKLEKNLEQQAKIIIRPGKDADAKYLKLDDEFHAIICSFSGTQLAWNTIESLKANMDRIRYFTVKDRLSAPDQLIKEHQVVVDAIKSKDFDLCYKLLKEHLYEISKTYEKAKEANSEWFSQSLSVHY